MFEKHVDTKLIEKYLERHGWHAHQALDQVGAVLTGWHEPTGDQYAMVIKVLEQQHAVMFQLPGLLKAPLDETPADRLSGLLLMLGLLNYELVLGKWAYDPADGEVSFRCGVPADGELSYEQFERHLVATMAATLDVKTLQAILSGEKTADVAIKEEKAKVG